MNITISYPREFSDVIEKIKSEHGQEFLELEGIGSMLDTNKFASKFFDGYNVADNSVDPNANVDDNTVTGFITESNKAYLRLNSLYYMWKKVKALFGIEAANSALEAEILGSIYIHDLTGYAIKPYCWAMSAAKVVSDGLPFIKRAKSHPAKHLDTYIEHIAQTVMYMSNQIDGAVAIPDFLIMFAYFVKKDIENGIIPSKNKDEKLYNFFIEQNMQKFIYIMNQPVRWGQSPFTNLSIFDKIFIEKLYGDLIYPDGSSIDIDLIMELQYKFMDVLDKEFSAKILTFPVMTLALARDENGLIDEQFARSVMKYVLPHANYNIYIGEVSKLSSCCRLRNDLSNMYVNSFGSSNSNSIGSHRVCTINMPRIGLISTSETEYFANLKKMLDTSYRILKAHRFILRDKIKRGKLPLYTLGFMDLNRQFSTFGIIGLYESVELMGIDPLSDSGLEFQKKILDYINDYIASKNDIKTEVTYIIEFTDNTSIKKVTDQHVNILRQGEPTTVKISELRKSDIYKNKRVKKVRTTTEEIVYIYNLEQVPGESAAVKLCKKDKLLFKTSELNKYHLYSNQFVPLHINETILNRMKIHGMFDSMTSGGAILHLNVEGKIESEETMWKLIKKAIDSNVIYFAINYDFYECQDGHVNIGKTKTCNICGKEIVISYTRVVGFITPKGNWAEERRSENRIWNNLNKEI